ncbi:uncharacterized protein LOC135848052 isoform X2 [Planococcus citri]
MSEAKFTFLLIAIISALIGQRISLSEARYLPTRSQEDRLVKLRELLQDLLKPEDRGVLQMKDHAAIFGNGYFTPDEYAAVQDEGYVVPYDRRDADSRMARNFYRQQQITKT